MDKNLNKHKTHQATQKVCSTAVVDSYVFQ